MTRRHLLGLLAGLLVAPLAFLGRRRERHAYLISDGKGGEGALYWGWTNEPVSEWGVIRGAAARLAHPPRTVSLPQPGSYLPCPDPSPEVPADGVLHDIGDGWGKASFGWQG